ncbi:MAG: hypothetical protein JO255_22430 [Alphaproteobacteria bacterium]|nr:hypothetical protein [Alphaproteobacteria bacterium]
MAKPKDRSNSYWLKRIERDHPKIFAKLRSGEVPTVRAARLQAGLLRQPTRLEKFIRDWDRLSTGQRGEFLQWVKSTQKPTPEPKRREEVQEETTTQLKFF